MLTIALKEWSIVCDLILEGRLACLLRKGGIHEKGGPGVFRPQHDAFALFPSWAHQRPQMIKPPWRDRVRVADEPDEITFAGIGRAEKVWQVPSRAAFDVLEDTHCWTTAQVDMRFAYKPQRPLYVMAVRTARLLEPKTVPNVAAYKGCRSWVQLRPGDEVDELGAENVMEDQTFKSVIARIDEAMHG